MFTGERKGGPHRARGLYWLAGLLAAALLAACAASDERAAGDVLSEPVAQETFAVGLQQISERYIQPVPVETLALEGLNGLDSIDDRIHFKRTENRLHILFNGRVVKVLPVAEPSDADGWAQVTTAAIASARHVSSNIGRATSARLYEAVFDGMLSKLDPFSRYAGAEQARANQAKRRGFGGIGIEFLPTPSGAQITGVFSQTPAEAAGLREGDVIVSVDGRAVGGLDLRIIRDRLRGAVGSRAELGVERPGHAGFMKFVVRRAKVLLPTVTAEVQHGILNLEITGFNDSTAREVVKAVRAARARPGINGVLLDLRSNPGGLLMQAVEVADLFLEHGRIVSTRGRHPGSSRDYDAHDDDIARGLPMVVLINGRSASASEIVAAALQDHERAVVIGSGSFGKGTVQTVSRLPNNGEITLTWSRFITPSGYTVHELGLTPSICTNLDAASVSEVIADALDHAAGVTDRLERWRLVSWEDHAERRRLRELCPAAEGKRKLEILIAERLLTEPRLFHRVMAMAPTLAARSP